MNDEDAARVRAKFNDADYIARLKSGDEDALDEFTDWLYRQLPRHIARKFNKSFAEAEDLASAAARHVRDRLDWFGKIAHEGAFEYWVYKVVHNKVLDELDRQESAGNKELRKLYELEIRVRDNINIYLADHEAAILGALESEEQQQVFPERIERLRRFLTLSKSDWSILMLRDVAGYDYNDIAHDELRKDGTPITDKTFERKTAAIWKRYERAKERAKRLNEEESS